MKPKNLWKQRQPQRASSWQATKTTAPVQCDLFPTTNLCLASRAVSSTAHDSGIHIPRTLIVLEFEAYADEIHTPKANIQTVGDDSNKGSIPHSRSAKFVTTLYQCTTSNHIENTNDDQESSAWKIIIPHPIDENDKLLLRESSLLATTRTPKSSSKATMSFSAQFQEAFQDHVLQHFLPAHYPGSVQTGYARFATLQFAASVAGSTAMVLSTQTLLLAVGIVGSTDTAEASIMAGALNWVLKDGIGQLGGVIFASSMGHTGRFDANPKQWRMVAAAAMDVATLMEILSPTVHAAVVLPLACASNVLKNIGFLTASASRAALHQSMAVAGNLADVTAKAGSQSMAAGLLGTTAGIGLSTLVLGHDTDSFLLAFCGLAMIHQACNYAALKAVPLPHLNRHRFHLVLHEFLISQSDCNDSRRVASPSWVAEREVFLPLWHPDDAHTWLSIGSRLPQLCPNGADEFTDLLQACPSPTHIVNQTLDERIHLVFLQDATGEDLLRGMLHAYLLRNRTSRKNADPPLNVEDIAATYQETMELFPVLLQGLHDKGWMTETNVTNIEPSTACRLKVQL